MSQPLEHRHWVIITRYMCVYAISVTLLTRVNLFVPITTVISTKIQDGVLIHLLITKLRLKITAQASFDNLLITNAPAMSYHFHPSIRDDTSIFQSR